MYSEDFESFEPIDFLDFAKELYASQTDFESNSSSIKRTIINRTYYAAFLQVRNWFIKHKGYKPNQGDNYKIPDLILNDLTIPLEPFRKNLRDHLIILKKNRHHCDYYCKVPEVISEKDKHFYSNSFEDLFYFSEELIRWFTKEDIY